ncbi:outer membrane beta-barrel protein [bacterium]|nr:outer membrane beta-barrel protein [bacterium]
MIRSVAIFLLFLAITSIAAPNDAKSGFYFAPMLTSGHFGITAHNLPISYAQLATPTLTLNSLDVAPDRGLSLGGKLGIFFRPEIHERKNRCDFEVQFEYAPAKFWFQTIELENGVSVYGQDKWDLKNMNLVGRFRWSAEVGDRWQAFVHFGYDIDFITLESATALSNGLNLGAGMRVRLCDHYAFYFEYETASLKTIKIAYADIDATANLALRNSTGTTGYVTLKPNYSMVSVAFEFPIEFCMSCKDKKNRGDTPRW